VVGKRRDVNRHRRGLFSRQRFPEYLDDAAGQKDADVVQNRVQIHAKDQHVQIRIRVERLAEIAQRDVESKIDTHSAVEETTARLVPARFSHLVICKLRWSAVCWTAAG
jgi:hypothetical protein